MKTKPLTTLHQDSRNPLFPLLLAAFVVVLSVTCFASYSFGVDEGKKLLALGSCERCDLSGANLRGADLSGAWLREANLNKADLQGAKLSDAWLFQANLTEANLAGADLSKAELTGADLQGANLKGANLFKAKLWGADLRGANLSQADLGQAELTKANLTGADLTGAILKKATILFPHQVNRSRTHGPGPTIFCKTKTPWGLDNSGCKIIADREKLRNIPSVEESIK